MNKRNIAITAAAIAAFITVLLSAWPGLSHSTVMGYINLPAIALAMLLSHGSHSPTTLAGWTAFLSWTLLYLLVFVVLYAFLAEFLLVRGAAFPVASQAFQARHGITEFAPVELPVDHLARIGSAVAELERRRRSHFLLADIKELDLSQPPAVLGAHAVARFSDQRSIKMLLNRFESETAAARGPDEAARVMRDVRAEASKIASGQTGAAT